MIKLGGIIMEIRTQSAWDLYRQERDSHVSLYHEHSELMSKYNALLVEHRAIIEDYEEALDKVEELKMYNEDLVEENFRLKQRLATYESVNQEIVFINWIVI